MGEKLQRWAEVLSSGRPTEAEVVWEGFDPAYANRVWAPSDADRRAAHSFHVELISRIATQPLGYTEGEEARTLTSVFELFGRARTLTEAQAGGVTFETLVWFILNVRVRPFTAKWHARSEQGALEALDGSDEFRAELMHVQLALRDLDRMLCLIIGPAGYLVDVAVRPDRRRVASEMARSVAWRPMGVSLPPTPKSGNAVKAEPKAIPEVRASAVEAIDATLVKLAMLERAAVIRRRTHYGSELSRERDWAAGLALSGGGIRSATFSLGVLAALARRDLLWQFDYLSSVSGGGYTASFLAQYLSSKDESGGIGLRSKDRPFVRQEAESKTLRTLRQHASYLTGSLWERIAVAAAQAHGVLLNFLCVALCAAFFAYAVYLLQLMLPAGFKAAVSTWSPIASGVVFIGLAWLRSRSRAPESVQRWLAIVALALIVPILWVVLATMHEVWRPFSAFLSGAPPPVSAVWIPAAVCAAALMAVAAANAAKLRPAILLIASLVFLLFLEATAFDGFRWLGPGSAFLLAACEVALTIFLWLVANVNVTSLHSYYRAKLASAFLIDSTDAPVRPVKLSEIAQDLSIFPILNGAINVPGSTDPAMRGRLADIFSFTPVACGASIIGYQATDMWEKANPDLDLATAMALSGAAVSPQMGLRTDRYASFWLTLLNLRLGAWILKPQTAGPTASGGGTDPESDNVTPTDELNGQGARPGIPYLLRELTATADEHAPLVHVSDGGHIENLGIYELLRRRCRFIVAVDGENDPRMTFHALTNLQRLSYIDFGITLDLDLNDLRLSEAGYSRSHFRLSRILYPTGPKETDVEIGYLIYLKLSLTGNEGEFLRRYKLDEPAFPHHATADQFFSEPQFEAYRALGEHVGDKLFLPAIAGEFGTEVDLETWFARLGGNLLDPLPHGPSPPGVPH